MTALDQRALVRLRDGGGQVTGYVRLPFGVLVSRTVSGSVRPADVTVPAADLLGTLELLHGRAGETALPASRDVEWRAALPPLSGWRRLDEVPGDVVRSLVRAGAETLRAVPAGATASAGESLLDHEALTVSGAGRTVAVPLRVLTALVRMGFLGGTEPAGPGGSAGPGPGGSGGMVGPGGEGVLAAGGSGGVVGPGGEGVRAAGGSVGAAGAGGSAGRPVAETDVVVVSAAGGWVRLAAAYGSAYHRREPALGLSPR